MEHRAAADNKLTPKLLTKDSSPQGRGLGRLRLSHAPLRTRSLELPKPQGGEQGTSLSVFHKRFSRLVLEVACATLRIKRGHSSNNDWKIIKGALHQLGEYCLGAFARRNLSETEFSMEFLFCLSNKVFSPLQTNILKTVLEQKSMSVLSAGGSPFSSVEQHHWIDVFLKVFNHIELSSLLDGDTPARFVTRAEEKPVSRNCCSFLNWFIKRLQEHATTPAINPLEELARLKDLFLVGPEQEGVTHILLLKEFNNLLEKIDEKSKVSILKDFRKKSESYGRELLVHLMTDTENMSQDRTFAIICQRTALALFLALHEHFENN